MLKCGDGYIDVYYIILCIFNKFKYFIIISKLK